LVPSTVKLLHRKRKGKVNGDQDQSMGIKIPMRVYNSTGKGTSSMDKFSSKVHGVHMELGGKLLNSLRIRTQFLERLQSVSVVDGATHTQKDDVESKEAPWRMLQGSLCCSFAAFSWF